jgi:hypothetical protein
MTIGAVELALRHFGLPFREVYAPSEYATTQFDPELGWVYMPNKSLLQRFGADRRDVALHFNSTGFRVRLPGDTHSPARPTALFIGCSFTMGEGLPFEETFVGQLEGVPDFPFQVINLGVQGYGTDQSLLLMKRYFKRFNTQAVVYTFIEDHVARNANYDRRLLHTHSRFVGTKPLFIIQPDGTPALQKKPMRYTDFSYSRTWALLQRAWLRWGPVPSFNLTRALIQEMQDYVESQGATLVVLDWNWSQRPSHLREMELNLIDTADDPPAGWNTWMIPGDSHPNAQAHQHVARLIGEKFKRLHLFPH